MPRNQQKSHVISLQPAEFLAAPARSTSLAQPMPVRFRALGQKAAISLAAQIPAHGISSAAAALRSRQTLRVSGSTKQSPALRTPAKLPAADRQKAGTPPKSVPAPVHGTLSGARAAARLWHPILRDSGSTKTPHPAQPPAPARAKPMAAR